MVFAGSLLEVGDDQVQLLLGASVAILPVSAPELGSVGSDTDFEIGHFPGKPVFLVRVEDCRGHLDQILR